MTPQERDAQAKQVLAGARLLQAELERAKAEGNMGNVNIVSARLARQENKVRELQDPDEYPILYDLREKGLIVDTIKRLASNDDRDECWLPVFNKHLKLDYNFMIKGCMAILISRLKARSFWDLYADEFYKLENEHSFYSDMLAGVFFKTAKLNDIETIISIIDNAKTPSRVLLLAVLRKYRRKAQAAEDAIQRLSKNACFAREIASWPRPLQK